MCNFGYVINGIGLFIYKIICQVDGIWLGVEFICEGKFVFLYICIIFCVILGY